jgi:RHS repeat-associated protein
LQANGIGDKHFELTNHLGNVLNVITDRKLAVQNGTSGTVDYFTADVVSYSDYDPFGMLMPNRHSGSGTRYGFQGQQKDDEVSGEGNSYTAEFWQYSPRIGKRWNIDPVVKPHESPYACFANNPILFIDPKGDDVVNGDRLNADDKKAKMDKRNENLTNFKCDHNIEDEMNKKDFIIQGGTKSDWKNYKELQTKATDATADFDKADARANITQGIIDNWKISSPNLYDEVDNQVVNFVLYSLKTNDAIENKGYFGATTPAYEGTDSNPKTPKNIKVKIAEGVNLSRPDMETGEYSLNHEAGHFLYIAKFTAEYIKYYFESVKNNTYVEGGHGKTDESGKVATKYGLIKDVTLPAPVINVSGN